MNEQREQDLLERAVAGDQAAREQCAAHFGPRVVRMVEVLYGSSIGLSRIRLTKCLSAEDLVQETWFVLCNNGWKLRAEHGQPLAAVLMTYLATTARNLYANARRTVYESRTRFVTTAFRADVCDDTVSIRSKAANREQHLRIRAWVDRQNERDRQLLRAYMLGEPYAEVAERMGLTADAVGKRIQRLLARCSRENPDDFGAEVDAGGEVAE